MRRDLDSDDGATPIRNDQLPCSFCQHMTLKATLANYGARCFPCFEAYCREPQPMPRWMADKRTGGPKAWARALKAREEASDRLSPPQRAMWREALKFDRPETHEPAIPSASLALPLVRRAEA